MLPGRTLLSEPQYTSAYSVTWQNSSIRASVHICIQCYLAELFYQSLSTHLHTVLPGRTLLSEPQYTFAHSATWQNSSIRASVHICIRCYLVELFYQSLSTHLYTVLNCTWQNSSIRASVHICIQCYLAELFYQSLSIHLHTVLPGRTLLSEPQYTFVHSVQLYLVELFYQSLSTHLHTVLPGRTLLSEPQYTSAYSATW